MKKIVVLVVSLIVNLLADLGYPHITYDSNTHQGKYELTNEFIPEPKFLKSIQNLPLEGEYHILDKEEKLYGINNFKDGIRDGKQIDYIGVFRSVIQTLFYINGKIEGKYTKHSLDGKLLETGMYKNNSPIGIEKQYNKNGDLIVTIKYIDGKKFLRTEYNKDKNKIKEVLYRPNAHIEKQKWYENNGTFIEESYDDIVKFDADRLSKVLSKAFLEKSCILENNTYNNIVKKYYYESSYPRKISERKTISWEEAKVAYNYEEAIYSNGKLMESILKDKKKVYGITYYDKDEKVRKSYWHYGNSILLYKNNKDGSIDTITCEQNNSAYTIYHSSRTEQELGDSDGVRYYEEYTDMMLSEYQYKGLILRDRREKQSKKFFDTLRKELITSGELKPTPFVEFFKYFDKKGKILKVIDFINRKIIKYNYLENGRIHQIICQYNKGQCSIENISSKSTN